MAIKYVKPSIWNSTWQNFLKKQQSMNATLKEMGYRRSIPKTKALDAILKKQLYFDDRELIKLANKRRKDND